MRVCVCACVYMCLCASEQVLFFKQGQTTGKEDHTFLILSRQDSTMVRIASVGN